MLLSTHQSHHPQGHQIAPVSGPWLAFHCWNLTSTFTIIWIYILHTFSGVRPPGPLGCQPLQSIKHLPDWPTASNKRSQKYQFCCWKKHRKENIREHSTKTDLTWHGIQHAYTHLDTIILMACQKHNFEYFERIAHQLLSVVMGALLDDADFPQQAPVSPFHPFPA